MAALIGIAYFFMVDIALYFLNPGYELILASAGDYNAGGYGLLVASAFFGLGLGSLALVVGLYRGVSGSRRPWLGLLMLGIWGVGMLVAGIFPASNAGSTVPHLTTVWIVGIFPIETEAYPDTRFGWIHILSMLGSFFSLTLATVLLSWRFRQDENWHGFHRLALILALVMLAASILFFLPPYFLIAYTSFTRGIFILAGFVTGLMWLLLTMARLRYVANGRYI
jgi:hypothetical protein